MFLVCLDIGNLFSIALMVTTKVTAITFQSRWYEQAPAVIIRHIILAMLRICEAVLNAKLFLGKSVLFYSKAPAALRNW